MLFRVLLSYIFTTRKNDATSSATTVESLSGILANVTINHVAGWKLIMKEESSRYLQWYLSRQMFIWWRGVIPFCHRWTLHFFSWHLSHCVATFLEDHSCTEWEIQRMKKKNGCHWWFWAGFLLVGAYTADPTATFRVCYIYFPYKNRWMTNPSIEFLLAPKTDVGTFIAKPGCWLDFSKIPSLKLTELRRQNQWLEDEPFPVEQK